MTKNVANSKELNIYVRITYKNMKFVNKTPSSTNNAFKIIEER